MYEVNLNINTPKIIGSDAEVKLRRINDIWEHFFLVYKLCDRKIKSTEDIKSNYVSDILGYFNDTFEIVFEKRQKGTITQEIAYNISFLQSLYVQQDFIEELLTVFKCNISKGDLKSDPNYSINRDIRNELVGHPIKKDRIDHNQESQKKCDACGRIFENGNRKSTLVSSTLFGYHSGDDKISYLRFHRKDRYKAEVIELTISQIQERHMLFLNKYLDRILDKLKKIILDFRVILLEFQKLIDGGDFKIIVSYAEICFESIYVYGHFKDKESILGIYNRRYQHPRYQNIVNDFFQNLKSDVNETIQEIKRLTGPLEIFRIEPLKPPEIKITFSDTEQLIKPRKRTKYEYNYELGKLAGSKIYSEFEMYKSFLLSHCNENKISKKRMNEIKMELEHMDKNLNDDLEYYSAYKYLCKIIKHN